MDLRNLIDENEFDYGKSFREAVYFMFADHPCNMCRICADDNWIATSLDQMVWTWLCHSVVRLWSLVPLIMYSAALFVMDHGLRALVKDITKLKDGN